MDFFWSQICIWTKVMSILSNLDLHCHLQSVHWNLYWKCDPQMVNWNKIISTCSYLFTLCKYIFHISNKSLYIFWVLVTVINCLMSMRAKKRRWFKTQSLNNKYLPHTRRKHAFQQNIKRTNNFHSKLKILI